MEKDEHIQTLELADSLFPQVLAGEKTRTLRWREGEIRPGYLLYTSFDNPAWKALVWVTGCRDAPMNEMAPLYDMSPEDLHKSMQRHYPDIEIDSPVTLVEHLTPRQTAEEHGVPESLRGEILMSAEELNSEASASR
ncbi:MAG: ASCH domain-containing protein [Alphaproteobacteria bacterium]|nr:ASCH domain-containing protein [Alphaproteobacteria bacterium]